MELPEPISNFSSPPSTFLPARWSTPRLRIADSTLADASRLTAIFNACNYAQPWDPTFRLIKEEELSELIRESLSTEGEDLYFRMQTLRIASEDDPIGYFHLSHWSPRLPQADTVTISMFVIDPARQRQGYAQEVAAGLAENLAQLGYMAIWLDVYLKNWPALRFWIQQGFTHIVEYEGAPTHSESAHASLILERRLVENYHDPN
ncbi:MAG: GNAT family N-acetyltransferase [Caldilineaceae bacterium]|nr:GNAT family N-acetyltransferase [Caldilineaceae bacterium]